MAYELRRSTLEDHPTAGAGGPLADHDAREALYRHLSQALTTVGFLQPDPAESVMRQFRRLLGRACMTEREVKLLRGVARQVIWAATRGEPGAGE